MNPMDITLTVPLCIIASIKLLYFDLICDLVLYKLGGFKFYTHLVNYHNKTQVMHLLLFFAIQIHKYFHITCLYYETLNTYF